MRQNHESVFGEDWTVQTRPAEDAPNPGANAPEKVLAEIGFVFGWAFGAAAAVNLALAALKIG